ncbi:MAG: AIR synthase-related protein [Cytophagales bacterium]|nr:AIR synthase-related protein [Cytophagales bacterium]
MGGVSSNPGIDIRNKKYTQRGVSSSKEDVVLAIRDLDPGVYPNAFCRIVPDILGQNPKYVNLMHADGAGSKSSLAYIYWRETQDVSVFESLAQDALVMNIDDMACVGGVQSPMLFSSCIARNKRYIPAEVIKALIHGTEKFLAEMRKLDFSMHLSGGETADLGDNVRTLVVDATATCRMPKKHVIENHIQPGDVIVGCASDGQATYEKEYNSGIASNGLSALRHDLFKKEYLHRYPESLDPHMDASLAYAGSYSLHDVLPRMGISQPLGKLALSPTRTYAPLIRDVLEQIRDQIHGIIHCSGGGQYKVLPFLKGCRAVKDQLFQAPPIFRILPDYPHPDLYHIFNMGHRLEFYTSPKGVETILDICKKYKIQGKAVGFVEASSQAEVRLILPE